MAWGCAHVCTTKLLQECSNNTTHSYTHTWTLSAACLQWCAKQIYHSSSYNTHSTLLSNLSTPQLQSRNEQYIHLSHHSIVHPINRTANQYITNMLRYVVLLCALALTNIDAASISASIVSGAIGKGSQAYSPNPVNAGIGDTVTWVNHDSVAHTVTAQDGSFDRYVMNAICNETHHANKTACTVY